MLAVISMVWAVEGMWLPEHLSGQADALQKLGFKLPAAQIGDPKQAPLGAIVHVGDYCSGSFVSADGLVLTNHHCTWSMLQYNTDEKQNRIQDGYQAAARNEELPAGPSEHLYILEKDEDITDRILKNVKSSMTDAQRANTVSQAKATAIARCEKQADRRCEVTAEFGGLHFRLLTHRMIRDVRLVYVPPMTVGSFGGDTDNFEWPRHDGDFAVLRAYVAPDGSARAYNSENVPYHPPHYLHVQPAGIQPGDAVMIAGFPGATQRYDLTEELRFRAEVSYVQTLKDLQRLEMILAEEVAKDPKAQAALGEAQAELANSRKYYQGVLDNVASSDILATKAKTEAEFRAWIAADPNRAQSGGPILVALDQEITAKEARWAYESLLSDGMGWSNLLWLAHQAVHLAYERQKKDTSRDEGYQERDVEALRAESEDWDQSFYGPADRRIFSYLLQRAGELPKEHRIAPLDAIAAQGESALDTLYNKTILMDAQKRLGLFDMTLKEIKAVQDPWVQLALSLEPLVQDLQLQEAADQGADLRLRPQWMSLLLAKNPASTYPDANNTLRISYGTVLGYRPRDAVQYSPQTTVAGMLAKALGGAYVPPPDWVMAWAKGALSSSYVDKNLGDVPVDFLSDVDSTGGNSGSATLNAQGELVGLLFDGNYESMAADWLFDENTTRSVHVDIRYVLWLMAGQPQTQWVAQELVAP